jgi:hypothetical protein
MNNNNFDNKHKGTVAVVAMIAVASLLSLGAFAVPAYAGGDGGDGVKQKAEAEADCDQKNKVEDGSLNLQTNLQELCAAISLNINDFELLG